MNPPPPIPAGFHEVYGPDDAHGRLLIGIAEDPSVFWVAARGWIGVSAWERVLAHATAFGRVRKAGWSLVIDAEGAWSVHPGMARIASRLRALPHLERTVALAPKGRRSLVERWASALPRPDHLCASAGEALSFLRERGTSAAA